MEDCLNSYFAKYDADGSGSLSSDELWTLLEDLGLAQQIGKDMLEIQMRAMDTNDDGLVSRDEFVNFMKNTPLADSAGLKCSGKTWDFMWSTDHECMNWLVENWKYYDADGSGSISKEEFKSMVTACGCPTRKLTHEFNQIDGDRTGHVSFAEFITWAIENWDGLVAGLAATPSMTQQVREEDANSFGKAACMTQQVREEDAKSFGTADDMWTFDQNLQDESFDVRRIVESDSPPMLLARKSRCSTCCGTCIRTCCGTCIGGCLVWTCTVILAIYLSLRLYRHQNVGIQVTSLDSIYRSMVAHDTPEMANQVREKTIWLYWDPPHTMPDFVKLCTETIELHKGSFDVRLLSKSNVTSYVSHRELPLHWNKLRPAQMKDALMNALLARYGGIALDVTVVMFRPFDDMWDDMLRTRATLVAYAYFRWLMPQVAVYFLMAPRSNLFGNVVAAQVLGMGDREDTTRFKQAYDIESKLFNMWYLAMGHGVITPVLAMYDSSLLSLLFLGSLGRAFTRAQDFCFPTVSQIDKGNARHLILLDPKEARSQHGVQLDWCDNECPQWVVTEHKRNWIDFQTRFRARLPFIKMFSSGGSSKSLSRSELLSRTHTFFFHWLCLARMPIDGCRKEYQIDG